MSAADLYATLGQQLRGLLEVAGRQSAACGEPVLVSTATAIPTPNHARLFQGSKTTEWAHWEQPDQGISLTAIGSTARLAGHGDHRFPDVTEAWRNLRSSALLDTAEGFPFALPIGLGGFAFHPTGQRDPNWSDFSDGLLIVPRLLFVSHGDSSWLCLNQMATPDSNAIATAESTLAELRHLFSNRQPEEEEKPSAGDLSLDEISVESWRNAVGQIIEKIDQGSLDKAVLARRIRVHSAAPLNPVLVLDRLRNGYSGCTIFAFAFGDTTFLGATPERLIRLDGQRLRADCLAGSTARGTNEQEDQSLGKTLLADAKERHEHALVVRAAREMLAPLCSQLSVADAPTLLKMPTVQHLHTPVEGSLRSEGHHLLDLVAQLHPTPASGGLPRAAAASLIREHEPFDRGWYAGPIGWIDGNGDGEFVVAIRSALLREREALLYAGCGIVAGSDPDHEYHESCLKLRAMLWALNGQRS